MNKLRVDCHISNPNYLKLLEYMRERHKKTLSQAIDEVLTSRFFKDIDTDAHIYQLQTYVKTLEKKIQNLEHVEKLKIISKAKVLKE